MKLKTVFAMVVAMGMCSVYASTGVSVRADVKTRDMKVKLQEDGSFKIRSWHEIYVNNPTLDSLRFRHVYYLCAENKGCSPPVDSEFVVPPRSEKRIEYNMVRKIAYDRTGRYEYSAKTEVWGIVNDARESRSNIYVYK